MIASMGFKSPMPKSLREEAEKATKILTEFTLPSAKQGPDRFIPDTLFHRAKGLAILSVLKAGFLFTARVGSGVVIARLPGGGWSAPSAVSLVGIGGGFEAGLEITDFVLVLTTDAAVEAFSKGGNLTLGGNFTLAAGPLGRNLEGDVTVRRPSSVYAYSKTRGLFAGMSLEGSALIERKQANRQFYGRPVRATELLSAEFPAPIEARGLYEILENHTLQATNAFNERTERRLNRPLSAGTGNGNFSRLKNLSARLRRASERPRSRSSDIASVDEAGEEGSSDNVPGHTTPPPPLRRAESLRDVPRKAGQRIRQSFRRSVRNLRAMGGSRRDDRQTRPVSAVAIRDFEGQIPCDLSFSAGDIIEVITSTSSQCDWWEGLLNDRVGLFPAAYVSIVESQI